MIPFYEHKTDILQAEEGRFSPFPAHIHACIELLTPIQGSVRLMIDGNECDIPESGMAVIFPNVLHAYLESTSPEPAVVRMIICQPEAAGAFRQVLDSSVPRDAVLLPENLHRDVRWLLDGLLESGETGADHLLISAQMQLLVARLLPALTLQPRDPSPTLTSRIIGYVSDHFREPLSLENVSRALGIGRSTVSRIFSGTLQVGFCRYLNELRVQYAQKLLLSSDLRAAQICELCGFANQQTFNRSFLEISGCTPTEYRRRFLA